MRRTIKGLHMNLSTVSAASLLSDLRSGALSAESLMQETLARIAEVNPKINAIVALREADDLLAEARQADAAESRGPLHGLPIAIKDLMDVKGIVSSHGSPKFAHFVPEKDDLVAERIRAAGAILIGKTNTPEFGLGSHTFNPVYGATGNPYAPELSCGGSSGGAAAALAAGMLALADGSDMMGSLRNPAGWCNVYGFRPSFGRVPSEPIGDNFLHQLATLGPMARSPADIAILLDVMSGPDPRLPHRADYSPAAPLKPMDMKGMVIGWLGDWGGAFPTEPGILDLSREALAVFEQLGANVEDVAPPFSADALWESWINLRSWSVATGLMALEREVLKDTAIWELERGLAMSAMEVHRASVIRSDWFKVAATLFEQYDALVLPTAQVWPFDVSKPYPTEINGIAMDTYHRWMQVVTPVSLLGLPALAMPAGFGDAGLPAGIQIFGPRDSDLKILGMGETYHEATGWPGKRPAF